MNAKAGVRVDVGLFLCAVSSEVERDLIPAGRLATARKNHGNADDADEAD